jgi:hypothetical protein
MSCSVRARCDEGWKFAEAVRIRADRHVIDLDAVVASRPTPTGYLIRRSEGTEVSLVFDAVLANNLPRVECGDHVRLLGVRERSLGEIELTHFSELYLLR